MPSRTGSYSRWQAGGRQVSDEILVSHVYPKSLHKLKLFYYPLCFTKMCYRYSYIDGFRVVFLDEIYCKVVFLKYEISKCVVFLTDPYYLTISMVK